jgi:ribosome-binding factor A
MIDRMDRVSKTVMREIAAIISTEIDDNRLDGVMINYAEVTRDLSLAKIYFTAEGTKAEQKEIEQILARYSRFIRGELARRIQLKFIPKLSFRVDEQEEYQRSIDSLIERISKELKDRGEEPAGEKNGEE